MPNPRRNRICKKDILTPDQYSKYEKMREQMRPGGPRGKRDDKKDADTKKD